MTIEEQLYRRFIASICRLKDVKGVSVHLLTEVSDKYLLKKVNSETKLSIKLREQDFLVQTAIITALMEASDTWQQFEELEAKQKVAANQIEIATKNVDNNHTDFDKLLVGIMNVPLQEKKSKRSKEK